MARLSIPPTGHAWVPFVPRPLYLSFHGFDWNRILKSSTPARDSHGHLRLFGVGFDYSWSRATRHYIVSAGAYWLVNLTAWRRYETPPERQIPFMRKLPPLRGFGVAILGLQAEFQQEGDKPWTVKLSFNHRVLRVRQIVPA